ncbi:MAG: SUMF1/EgtB/PvdO family nonheme iron enzyme [Isosphaeraceae bacterium]
MTLALEQIEQRVCDITSEQLGIPRERIGPSDRIIEDLHCDSLDLVELLMQLEETFEVTIPDRPADSLFKAIFARQPFRLRDLAELVYLHQGTGKSERSFWRYERSQPPPFTSVPFTQLGGRFDGRIGGTSLLEPFGGEGDAVRHRRRSDGMRCALIPEAAVELGSDESFGHADELPRHTAEVDAFLIDAEPVSTTAYCRFLNSAGDVPPGVLADWFVLDPDDDRDEHMLIHKAESGWGPVPGTERWPMILVSWFGANAYSLWANGEDWHGYAGEPGAEPASFLPSEAQWEYAARGARFRAFPWGDDPPSDECMRYARHRKANTYRADSLPMADVNAELGMSPFGLHHMAGNVWQWCRDWYDNHFYAAPGACQRNPVNLTASKTRSERGGSWVGPADLCRSSYRRGRPPLARGRCLGFRCIARVP